jgi:hypothetical protein
MVKLNTRLLTSRWRYLCLKIVLLGKVILWAIISYFKKIMKQAGHWWFTPLVLPTQKVKIRKIVIQGQFKHIHTHT